MAVPVAVAASAAAAAAAAGAVGAAATTAAAAAAAALHNISNSSSSSSSSSNVAHYIVASRMKQGVTQANSKIYIMRSVACVQYRAGFSWQVRRPLHHLCWAPLRQVPALPLHQVLENQLQLQALLGHHLDVGRGHHQAPARPLMPTPAARSLR